jgi:uncharacterized protein YuzE
MINSSLTVSYDRRTDVLYINVEHEPSVTAVEDSAGFVWRYSHSGALIGVTLVDFRELWAKRHDVLTQAVNMVEHALIDQ